MTEASLSRRELHTAIVSYAGSERLPFLDGFAVVAAAWEGLRIG